MVERPTLAKMKTPKPPETNDSRAVFFVRVLWAEIEVENALILNVFGQLVLCVGRLPMDNGDFEIAWHWSRFKCRFLANDSCLAGTFTGYDRS